MIRLRIERVCRPEDVLERSPENQVNGLVWHEEGRAVGRVIIEQETIVSEGGNRYETWIPVEVIDES